jgi:hypothetical protein
MIVFCIDLILLFKLISRVPNATNRLREIVENHIYEMGINALELVCETAINVSFIRIEFNLSFGGI